MDVHPTKIDIGFDPSPYRNTASSTGNWNSNSHGIKKQRNTILIVPPRKSSAMAGCHPGQKNGGLDLH
jgi:hypothetical protein